jgi:hypothetical protein
VQISCSCFYSLCLLRYNKASGRHKRRTIKALDKEMTIFGFDPGEVPILLYIKLLYKINDIRGDLFFSYSLAIMSRAWIGFGARYHMYLFSLSLSSLACRTSRTSRF